MIENINTIFSQYSSSIPCLLRHSTTTNISNSSSSKADSDDDVQVLVPKKLNMNMDETNQMNVFDVPILPYWLGFATLNALGQSRESPKEAPFVASEWIAKGMKVDEAAECENAKSSFSYVVQKQWSESRVDGLPVHYYNLTQISHDVEVKKFGYALAYQIAICFEIGDIALSKEVVLKLIKDRFTNMKIELGTLLGTKPILVLCAHNSSIWNGIVKIHMKFPQYDGTAMLTGVRPFILKLDESCYFRGKVCKTCDNIAPQNSSPQEFTVYP